MSRAVQMRIPSNLWGPLWDEVRRPATPERVVFGLASHGRVANKELVLIRELIFPPSTAFVQSANHGAMWSGAYNIKLLNLAQERDLGIVIFHHHPGGGLATMSHDDDQSARQLLPIFQMVASTRPHGSVVIGQGSAAGLILLPDTTIPVDCFGLRFFNDHITTLRPGLSPVSRSAGAPSLLVEEASKAALNDAVVAVVGLGGGGTQLASLLGSVGIGEIIGIDSQRVARDNLSSSDRFGWVDALAHRRKTAAMRSRLWWINRKVRFTAVDALLPEKPALEALKRADVIAGCVNNLAARADIQAIASRYCIPYVDIGLGLYPASADDATGIGSINGNVFTIMPGGPCLWCTGFISQPKLQGEAGGVNRSYLRANLLARNGLEPTSYVATFNSVLAGLAAGDVLQLILAYAPSLTTRKQYDGFYGTVTEMTVHIDTDCPNCSATLAAGDPIWH